MNSRECVIFPLKVGPLWKDFYSKQSMTWWLSKKNLKKPCKFRGKYKRKKTTKSSTYLCLFNIIIDSMTSIRMLCRIAHIQNTYIKFLCQTNKRIHWMVYSKIKMVAVTAQVHRCRFLTIFSVHSSEQCRRHTHVYSV